MSFKKNLFVAAALAAAVIPFTPSESAEARASFTQERSWEVWQLSDDQSKYRMIQSQKGSMLRKIQDRLVECNSNELNYKGGGHQRWLQPAWINEDMDEDRSYSLGGYVVLTQKKLDSLNQGRENTPTSLYNNSLVASPLAHEFAHFANLDTVNRVTDRDETRIKSEYKADETAWTYLENVPEFSVGSQLTDNILRKRGKSAFSLSNKKLASDDERIGAIIAHISKISGGRVQVSEDCRMTLDGRPFMGTGYLEASSDATKEERTAYLAGQIATCIGNGLWSRGRIDYMPESEMFDGGRPDRTVLVVREGMTGNGGPTGSIAKVLGVFEFPLNGGKYSRTPHEQAEIDAANRLMEQVAGREKPLL